MVAHLNYTDTVFLQNRLRYEFEMHVLSFIVPSFLLTLFALNYISW